MGTKSSGSSSSAWSDASLPPMSASSSPRSSAFAPSSISVPSRDAMNKSDKASPERSRTVITSSLGARRSERTSSMVVSKVCAKRTRASKPNAPAPPFMECTARKTAFTVSLSSSPSLIARRPASIASRSSSHSIKKVCRISSIGSIRDLVVRRRRGELQRRA